MSWGKHLWDQGDNVAVHTKKGIDFLDRYASFVTERCKVETDYTRQLKLLASRYLPKKPDEEDSQFTYRQAFVGMLGELTNVANQHQRVADQFRDEVAFGIGQLAKRLREQRKECLDEMMRLQNELTSSIEAMERSRKDYNRAYKESEAAIGKYNRAEGDMDLSRALVQKAKNNSIAKLQLAEDAKNAYALQLHQTNEFQHDYYTKLLPAVFERLRNLDETRIREISRFMNSCVDIELRVLPMVQKCLQGMLEHSSRIDEGADSSLVVQQYKTEAAIPGDYRFDDLSGGSSSSSMNFGTMESAKSEGAYDRGGNGQVSHSPAIRGNRRLAQMKSAAVGSIVNRVQFASRGKLASLFKSRSVDESVVEDYSDLSPQQQSERLLQRIDSVQKSIEAKVVQRNGLEQMQKVYRESHLGDVTVIDTDHKKCINELSSLESNLKELQIRFKKTNVRLNLPANTAFNTPVPTPGAVESVRSSFSSFESSPPSTPRLQPPNRPLPPAVIRPSLTPDQRHDNGDDSLKSEFECSVERCPMGKAVTNTQCPAPVVFLHGGAGHYSLTVAKPEILLSASPESGLGSGSSSSGVATTIAEDCDEWTRSDEEVESTNCQDQRAHDPKGIVLGTCKALYAFRGDGNGTMSMKEGEQMSVIDRDAGDGWTKVRKENSEQGFVPSSYLECNW